MADNLTNLNNSGKAVLTLLEKLLKALSESNYSWQQRNQVNAPGFGVSDEVNNIIRILTEAKQASNRGENIKNFLNQTTVGDPKTGGNTNEPFFLLRQTLRGYIPGLNLLQSMSTNQHNDTQIQFDLYRQQLAPLLLEQQDIEQKVLNSEGDWNVKKLKTMEMRLEFWKTQNKTFSNMKGNPYFEREMMIIKQTENDIINFKDKMNQTNSSYGFSNFDNKPEDILKKQLQNFRNIYLNSEKADKDYQQYKQSILDSTKGIDENQPELYDVITKYYGLLDYDLEQVGKAQSEPRQALSRLINDYAKGAGSITKAHFIEKLKEIGLAGYNSTDPEISDVGKAADQQLFIIDQAEKNKANKKAAAAKVIEDREARERYNALKAQNDLAIKEKSLEDESLQKHLDLNDLKAQADKDVINYRIKDEKAKADLLLDIERQRLEAAMNLEYEYAQKHSALYAGMQSGFGTMWSEFIVGSRKAKNSWDAVWLSMRNSALNKIGSELGNELMLTLFKKSSGSLSQKNEQANQGSGGSWLNDIINFAAMAIPFLAEGGIVHRPTLAMIGESGPEAVVPLDQMNSTKVIYVQPVINGNFDVSMHKLNLKLDQNKAMMEELY